MGATVTGAGAVVGVNAVVAEAAPAAVVATEAGGWVVAGTGAAVVAATSAAGSDTGPGAAIGACEVVEPHAASDSKTTAPAKDSRDLITKVYEADSATGCDKSIPGANAQSSGLQRHFGDSETVD